MIDAPMKPIIEDYLPSIWGLVRLNGLFRAVSTTACDPNSRFVMGATWTKAVIPMVFPIGFAMPGVAVAS